MLTVTPREQKCAKIVLEESRFTYLESTHGLKQREVLILDELAGLQLLAGSDKIFRDISHTPPIRKDGRFSQSLCFLLESGFRRDEIREIIAILFVVDTQLRCFWRHD